MGHNHNRPVYDDDRRPMSEFENRRQGNRIPVFDFDVSSVSPYRSIEVDRFRHRSDSGFRYREDYNDGFDQNQRDEPLLVRGDAMGDDYHGRSFSYRNGSPRGYRFNNSTQRDYVDHSRICEFESGSGLGDEFLRHRRGEVYSNEDQRRGHYSNRESTGEYKRIPRKKQSQKMSARLWLHKPNTRNKNEHSAALFDGPQPTSFRRKGTPSQLDKELLEKRERSLEELDVSFRSNVLVAKAIATPSSIVVSDRNVKSSIRNPKKVIVPNRNSSSSPIGITKLNEFPVKPDGLTHASSRQFTPNSKVEYSGSRTMLITNSQPCPSGTNKQTLKSIVERPEKCVDLDEKAANVGCDGSSFVKIRRKVKDAGPLSGQTDSERKRKPDESFDADSSLHGPFAGSRYVEGLTDSKTKSTSAGTVAKSEIIVDSCFPRAVAVKGSSGVDSSRPSVRKVKQKRSSSTHVLTSSISEKTKNNECYADADLSVHNLYTTTSSDKSLTCTKDTHTPDVETLKARKLSCKDDMIMQPENSSVKGFSDPSAKDSVCAPLLNSEEHGICGGTVNTCSPDHEINTTISCGKILTKTQQNSSVSGFATVEALGKQPCSNQICRSVGKDTLEKNQKPVSSGEPTTFCGLLNSNCSDRSSMAASGVDNGLSCFADALTVCDTAKESAVGMQLCPGGVTESSEYCTAQAFTNAGVSVGKNIHATSGKQHAPKTRRKKVRTLPSSLPSLSKCGTTPRLKNVTNPLLGVDGTLCNTIGNLLQVESTAPDKRSLDFGRTARIITKLENGSIEGSEDVTLLNGTSSDIIKKRENLLSHQDQDVPGSVVPDITMGVQSTNALSSSIAVPSNFGDAAMAQAKEGVAVHSTGMICAAGLLPSREGSDSCLLEEPLEAMGFARYGSHKVISKLGCPSTDLCAVQESVIQNMQLPCPSGLLGEQKENAMPVTVTTSGYWDDITNMENEKHNAVLHGNCAQDRNRILLKLQCSELSKSHLNTDVDRESLVCEKLDVPIVPLCTHHDGASCADHDDDPLDSASNELHDTGSAKTLSSHTDLQMFNGRKLDEKPILLGYSKFATHNVSSQNLQVISSSLDAMKNDEIIPRESTQVQSKNQKKPEEITNILNGVSHGQSNQLSNAVPTFFPSRPPFTSSKKLISSSTVARSRTWRRTDNPIMPPPPEKLISGKFPLPRQLLDKIGKRPSTTYVRKGNSLVRKSPSAASFPHDSIALGTSTVMKSIVSESTDNTKDSANSLTGELSISSSRPKTPPSQLSGGLSNCIIMPSRDNISYEPEIPLSDICVRNTSHPSKLTETKDAPKSSEGNNEEISSVVNDGNGTSSQNNLIYVKRKSNQLVAASNPLDLSTQNVDKTTPAFFYDGYYKRKKNQLIRTSLENQVGPTAAPPCVSLNCEKQRELEVSPCRSRNRRRSDKFSAKKYKSSKFSLVWTLGSTQSVKKDRYSAQCKVLPKLFPWKRSMHWRRSMHKSAPSYSSLSPIGKKLLLLRKRDTVYTRSSNGLSLRKSKVLSIGGSSLKWSKSIESRSKKANEEATLAVAEVEREKRQQSNADCVASSSRSLPRKSVDNLGLRPGERIFRIGLVRYKMDPSRCTLQRIADDESSCFMPIQTNNNLKKCYVPKRLLIGNDEYVRIGNGNQLVRDPKKRSRILASEKVRWSLHTARLRLAKNRKYCQFYTRFGKCNKDSGKCPYMHDPSKIAVCTKFLNGLCSNLNCKLTHKVIPERMPDCSYFLLGLCSNDKCPYRHVNVNPKASICEGFLKGYCADGDECRRKHSCVCPDYEANGVCYLGSKCKLHHPKRRKEGNKRKRSEDKNGWGRYFGSIHPDNAEAPLTVSERHGRCDIEDIFFKDGRYSDYISLDVSSDEEGGETCIPLNEQITEFEEHTSDSALDDLDNLIKPVRIMI